MNLWLVDEALPGSQGPSLIHIAYTEILWVGKNVFRGFLSCCWGFMSMPSAKIYYAWASQTLVNKIELCFMLFFFRSRQDCFRFAQECYVPPGLQCNHSVNLFHTLFNACGSLAEFAAERLSFLALFMIQGKEHEGNSPISLFRSDARGVVRHYLCNIYAGAGHFCVETLPTSKHGVQWGSEKYPPNSAIAVVLLTFDEHGTRGATRKGV
jgi:hypothetical protein